MAYSYVILSSAQQEYADIVHYLFEVLKSPQAAAGFVNEFDRQVDLVCNNPQGHALSRMSELAERGYRAFFINRYIALYKIEGELVVIAHIFHQTQDYARYV